MIIVVIVYLVCRGVVKSRVGRSMVAIRDNETAAAVMGVNLAVTKGMVFGLSAAMCALPGCLSAIRTGNVTPDIDQPDRAGLHHVPHRHGGRWRRLAVGADHRCRRCTCSSPRRPATGADPTQIPGVLRPLFGWSKTPPGDGIFAVAADRADVRGAVRASSACGGSISRPVRHGCAPPGGHGYDRRPWSLLPPRPDRTPHLRGNRMKRRTSTRLLAALAAGALLIAACGSDDKTAPTPPRHRHHRRHQPRRDHGRRRTDTTAATVDTTAAAGREGWAVNTDDCIDPDAANAPIEGTIKIGSAMPLTGGARRRGLRPGEGRLRGLHRLRQRERPARRPHDRGHHRGRPVQQGPHPRCGLEADRRRRQHVLRHHRLAEQPRRARHAQRGVHPAAERPHRFAGMGRRGRLPVDHRQLVPYTVESKVYADADRRAVPRRRHGRAVLREQRVRPGLRRRLQGTGAATTASRSSTSRPSRPPTPRRPRRRSPASPSKAPT